MTCPFSEAPVIRYLGPHYPATLISCPTCGRCDVADFFELAKEVESRVRRLGRPLTIAVMGCEVNGPGEAKDADVGIAFGVGKGALFKRGKFLRTVPTDECIEALFEEVNRTW